ncbi:hypothetical protein BC829DRAFT_490355 [Chytridium lagenaria]|nr:hypothetical protein BC829DRAFT_490355 [Chytridium lagenaria]
MPNLTLFGSPTSPFVRKVLIVARELGVLSSINVKNVDVLPTKLKTEVDANGNSLGKIPTLSIDGNQALFGSQVIAQYLIDFYAEKTTTSPALLPPQPRSKAALLARYEAVLRPEQHRWQEWTDGQLAKIHRSLDKLEKWLIDRPDNKFFDGNVNLGMWPSRLRLGTGFQVCAFGVESGASGVAEVV